MGKFTEQDYSFYHTRGRLYISTPFEGIVHIEKGVHGGESFFYVNFIEFDKNPTPEEIEEIEAYTENNLYKILKTAEKI